MMILFLLILGYAVYVLLKSNGSPDFQKQTQNKSVEILKQRYVDGEIGEEEYKRMIKIIRD